MMFKANPCPGGGTTFKRVRTKVGDFIGVTGTKNSDGSVSATTVMIGQPTRAGKGGPGGMGPGWSRWEGQWCQATVGCWRAGCVTRPPSPHTP